MKVVVRTVLIAAALPALLAGCATNQVHKGTVIDKRLVGAIQPGVDNKDSVEKLLGRPSFDGAFTSNDWYYVSRDTNQLGFANPRVRKTTVLHVAFDAKGNVTAVNETGRELVMNVNPTKRNTPTLGRQKSFFEELFGNIGQVGSGGIGGSSKP